MAEAHEWEELNEDEDEAEMKLKHLGIGGAATDWKVRVQNPVTSIASLYRSRTLKASAWQHWRILFIHILTQQCRGFEGL